MASTQMLLAAAGAISEVDIPLSAVWTDGRFDDANLTTYNFNGVLWGATDPARRLIFCVTAEASGTSALNINSVQVGPDLVAATAHVTTISTNGGNSLRTAIYSIPFSAQLSGRVRITLSRASRHCSLSAYSLIGSVRLVGVNSGFINGETLTVGTVISPTTNSVDIVSSAVGTVLPITYTEGGFNRDWLSGSIEYSMASGSSSDSGLNPVRMTVPPPGSLRLVMCRAAWERVQPLPPVAGQIESVTSGSDNASFPRIGFFGDVGSVSPIGANINGARVVDFYVHHDTMFTASYITLEGTLPLSHFTRATIGGVNFDTADSFLSNINGNTTWTWFIGPFPLTNGVTTPVVIS